MSDLHSPPPKNQEAVEILPGSRVGRFVIQERLGMGGMGEVYRAEDPVLKRSVALKRIAPQLRTDPKYRERLLKEAERASRLTDPHVAAVHDVLEQEGEMFLVMEYVDGQSLRQRMTKPFGLDEFFHLATQCVQALVAAHGRGILHCDIKPENIMIDPAGQVKILDFGLAKNLPSRGLGTTTDSVTSSSVGSVSGTPAYMSPEVLLEKPLDQRADIFSLGVVFYEALSGQNPFRADTFIGTSDRILREMPPPLSQMNPAVPSEFERVVAKMLAKEREQRYTTARDVLDGLQAVEPPHLSHRASSARTATKWIGAGVFIVAAIVATLILERANRSASVVVANVNQIAILPFQSIGSDPNARAFSTGLTETLTAKLTQLTDHYPLQVVPSSEVRGQSVTTVEQAHAVFGVNLVLEGGLEQSGQIVRINYSLVDGKTRRQLRAATLTADASDPFSVEDRVVEGATNMLNLELGPQQRDMLTDHGTSQPVAYDLYLHGRGFLQDYAKPEAVDAAIADFTQALDRDPGFALAYAGLGESLWHKYEHTHAPELLGRSKEACEHAVSLGPQLSNGNNCLGMVYNKTGKYEDAVQQFERALKLDPTSDEAYRGLALADEHLGKMAEAEATYRRAIAVRPNYWASYNWLGRFYVTQGRYQDAEKMLQQVVTLVPDSFRGYSNLGANYLAWGRYSEAVSALEKSVAIRPTSSAVNNLGVAYFYSHKLPEAARTYEQAASMANRDYRVMGNLGECYDRIPGKHAAAVANFTKAIVQGEKELATNPRDAAVLTNLALYYANLNKRQKALDRLKRGLALAPKDTEILLAATLVYVRLNDENEALQFLQKAFAAGLSPERVEHLPNLDSMRESPRFRALVQKTKSGQNN